MTLSKILITGGAGFIGSNLSLALVARGYEVTVLDCLHPQIHGEHPETDSPLFRAISGQVRFIEGSITDRTCLLKAIAGQEVIVHFAAETGTGQSMYEIERYNHVNTGGTALLMDLLTNEPNSVRRVVVASSRAIYGEGKYRSEKYGMVYPGPRPAERMAAGEFEVAYQDETAPLELLPTDEEAKIHPTSIYGITKQVQEQLVMTTTNFLGLEGVALRYQNVYGPGQSLSNPYTGILSIFSTLIRNGKEINIFEDGQESRDFVYIDDVVDATIRAIEVQEAAGQVFNVGSGVATSVETVVTELIKNFEMPTPYSISGNYRLGDIRHNVADLSKIRSMLGFVPQTDFSTGLTQFVEWVKRQSQVENAYEKSMSEMKIKGLFK